MAYHPASSILAGLLGGATGTAGSLNSSMQEDTQQAQQSQIQSALSDTAESMSLSPSTINQMNQALSGVNTMPYNSGLQSMAQVYYDKDAVQNLQAQASYSYQYTYGSGAAPAVSITPGRVIAVDEYDEYQARSQQLQAFYGQSILKGGRPTEPLALPYTVYKTGTNRPVGRALYVPLPASDDPLLWLAQEIVISSSKLASLRRAQADADAKTPAVYHSTHLSTEEYVASQIHEEEKRLQQLRIDLEQLALKHALIRQDVEYESPLAEPREI